MGSHRITSRIEAFDYVFALVGGDKEPEGKFIIAKNVYGTAFSIGGGFFITAAHSLLGAESEQMCGLGYKQPEGKVFLNSPINGSEIHENCDIAIIQSEFSDWKAFKWNIKPSIMAADVFSVGYPFALNLEQMSLYIRTFKGYLVSGMLYHELPGSSRCYELSFPCPKGLSGAPLLTENLSITGVISGNRRTSMEIYRDKEVVKEGNDTTYVERYDSFQIGLATQASSILQIESDILGCSLNEHLIRHDLLNE